MKRFIVLIGIVVFINSNSSAQLGTGLPEKFTRKDSLRGTLTPERANYDVKYYELDLKIDIEKKYISGSNIIRFNVIKNLPVLQFDLFDNLNITKVEWENKSLAFKREYNAVFVTFPSALLAGTKSSIKVYYEGNPTVAKRAPWDGGFVFKSDKDGKPFVAVACQGTGASLWWPTKDHQSDEPDSMAINITSPSNLEEVSNGRLRAKKDLDNGYTRFEWFVSEPINNYDVSINIADYAHWRDNYISNVDGEKLTLDYYVLKEDLEKAQKQFEQVKPMMDVFEKRFGKYPFYKDGYKLVQTPYLGMEHQSCVAYGNAYKNGYLGMDLSGSGEGKKFDYIIIHESAHEWWGNSITSYDIADMWIHEGFGQYAETVYLEEIYGKESANKYLEGLKRGVGNTEPIIGPYGVNKEGSGDMYPKGALFLNTLRNYINNDKIWWDIVASLQKKYRHKNISTEDVIELMELKSGKNLKPLFDVYLRQGPLPLFSVALQEKNNDVLVKYEWSRVVEDFKLPVKIKIKGSDNVYILSPEKSELLIENISKDKIVVDRSETYFKLEQK